MFKNDYQGGPAFEIFSSQGSSPLVNWKTGTAKKCVQKQYDSSVKGYVFACDKAGKLICPKDDKMGAYLVQPFLILQIFVPLGSPFSLELCFSDLHHNKRRIFMNSGIREIKATPLHASVPFHILKRGVWVNLCIDVLSFVNGLFSGTTFRALEQIVIGGTFKLRKGFTMRAQPPDTTNDYELYEASMLSSVGSEAIPRNLSFPVGVEWFTQLISMEKIIASERGHVNPHAHLGLGHQMSMPQLPAKPVLPITSTSNASKKIAFGRKIIDPLPQPRSMKKLTFATPSETISHALVDAHQYVSGQRASISGRNSQVSQLSSSSGSYSSGSASSMSMSGSMKSSPTPSTMSKQSVQQSRVQFKQPIRQRQKTPAANVYGRKSAQSDVSTDPEHEEQQAQVRQVMEQFRKRANGETTVKKSSSRVNVIIGDEEGDNVHQHNLDVEKIYNVIENIEPPRPKRREMEPNIWNADSPMRSRDGSAASNNSKGSEKEVLDELMASVELLRLSSLTLLNAPDDPREAVHEEARPVRPVEVEEKADVNKWVQEIDAMVKEMAELHTVDECEYRGSNETMQSAEGMEQESYEEDEESAEYESERDHESEDYEEEESEEEMEEDDDDEEDEEHMEEEPEEVEEEEDMHHEQMTVQRVEERLAEESVVQEYRPQVISGTAQLLESDDEDDEEEAIEVTESMEAAERKTYDEENDESMEKEVEHHEEFVEEVTLEDVAVPEYKVERSQQVRELTPEEGDDEEEEEEEEEEEAESPVPQQPVATSTHPSKPVTDRQDSKFDTDDNTSAIAEKLANLSSQTMDGYIESEDGEYDGNEEEETLELEYDPVAKCYFDPSTGKYYEIMA